MRLLVVEDNELVTELVKAGFEKIGWQVDAAHTLADGRNRLRAGDVDVVVLDIGLPDADGFSLLSDIRVHQPSTPVIMLTARAGADAVVKGLDAGADDYLAKPFDIDELIARVHALVRRSQNESLKLGNLTFNRLTRDAMVGGQRLDLTPKEQTFLEQLMLSPGKSVARDDLLQRVWRIDTEPESNLMDAHVARLRAKLRGASANVAIVTHRSAGYGLELVDAR